MSHQYRKEYDKQEIINHNINVARALGYDFYSSDRAYRYSCSVQDYVRLSTILCRVSMKASTILTSTIWSYGVNTVSGISSDEHSYIEQLDSLMPKIIRIVNDFGFCAIRINEKHIIELLSPPQYLIIDYEDYISLEKTNEHGNKIDVNIVTNGSQTLIKEANSNEAMYIQSSNKDYYIISGGINKASIAMDHVTWQEEIEYLVKQNMKIYSNPPAEVASNFVDDSMPYDLTPGGINKVTPRGEAVTTRHSPLMPPEITEHFLKHDQYNKGAIAEIYDLDLLTSENWITATRDIANRVYQMIKKMFPKDKDTLKFNSLVNDMYNNNTILSSEKVLSTIAELSKIDPSIMMMLDSYKFVTDTANHLNVFTDMLVPRRVFEQRMAQAQAQAQRQQDLQQSAGQ